MKLSVKAYDPVRWGTVTALLSMDRMSRFTDSMGLVVPDSGQLIDTLRRVIQQNRAEFSQSPSQVLPLKSRVMQSLRAEFGSDFAESFRDWVVCVFTDSPHDHLNYQHWRSVLYVCAGDSILWAHLSIPSARSVAVRSKLMESFDLSEVNEISDSLDGIALSKWDAEMYARHGFFSEFRDPDIWAINTASHHRFRNYIRWLVDLLSDAELTRVWENAHKVIRMSPELMFIENLIPLKSLDNYVADN